MSELGKRTFPFIMQPINSRVVRRSNALFDSRYGAPPPPPPIDSKEPDKSTPINNGILIGTARFFRAALRNMPSLRSL